MKQVILIMFLFVTTLMANSQNTYLTGLITGFDINSTGIDRPIDYIKLQGFIILDKEDLVIQTKRKGKEWVETFKVELIKDLGQKDNYTIYEVTCRDSQNKSIIVSLKIHDEQTWSIQYNDDKSKMNYEGLTMKKWVIDFKN